MSATRTAGRESTPDPPGHLPGRARRTSAPGVAEIVDGTLYTHPRPAMPHARASSSLGVEIGGTFDPADLLPNELLRIEHVRQNVLKRR